MTKTYQQFKSLGLGIKKGAKSLVRNDKNECLFDINQTLPVCLPEEIEGTLSEQEIQELHGYRQMMKERVKIAATNGNKICAMYLDMVNSHPLARQTDELGDWSDEADDIEIHY